LDHQFLAACQPPSTKAPDQDGPAIHERRPTVGTLLGSEISRRHGGAGLEPGTIDLTFHGSAGQSFGRSSHVA